MLAKRGQKAEDDGAPAIGGYAIKRKLGQGGCGVVYLAERVQTKDLVALKVMLSQVAVEADAAGSWKWPRPRR